MLHALRRATGWVAHKLGFAPIQLATDSANAQAFGVLAHHALMVSSMPVLLPAFDRASVRQTLSVMSVRPVNPLWFATQTGLSVLQNKQLLQYLNHAGCLQIMRVELNQASGNFDSRAFEHLLKGA
jgi:hypothetical protein